MKTFLFSPRRARLAGWVCLSLAFLPYYSHKTFPGPSQINLPLIGVVKGPPERTYFHLGLPWSPWVSYRRILDYQGPFSFRYDEGYHYGPMCWSAVPAVLGCLFLVAARRLRRVAAPQVADLNVAPTPGKADEVTGGAGP